MLGKGSQQSESLPADPGGSAAGEAIVLSDAVAQEVGHVFAASEDAARAIRAKAESEADLLVRGATREAAEKARQTVASVASESLPQLEARVSELRALVSGVSDDLQRLTQDLNRLAEGSAPLTLPAAAGTAAEPPVRAGEERRALLIALNMASNGASREEAARYLVEHLEVPDHDRLLDAVYGYVGPDGA